MVTRTVVPRWNVEKIDGNFIRDKYANEFR